jgi:hypothetical protein
MQREDAPVICLPVFLIGIETRQKVLRGYRNPNPDWIGNALWSP